MGELIPIVGIIAVFGSFSFVVVTISNFILKKRMIQSGQLDPENIKLITKNFSSFKFDNLKWGIILLFGGLGFIVIEHVPGYIDENGVFYLGIEMVFLAAGFLTYYFIIKDK